MNDLLENNRTYVSQSPKGESQLGKRGFYGGICVATQQPSNTMALQWMPNLSAASKNLLDIAECSGLLFVGIKRATEALLGAKLLVAQI